MANSHQASPAGWLHPVDGKGSHTKWSHRSGAQVTVPTGHRTVSPGVVRQVNKAIQQSQGK